MARKLSAEQMRKAKEKLAKSRGIGAESITNESVYLALDANNILLRDIGINSYNSDVDTSSFDSGSGCD